MPWSHTLSYVPFFVLYLGACSSGLLQDRNSIRSRPCRPIWGQDLQDQWVSNILSLKSIKNFFFSTELLWHLPCPCVKQMRHSLPLLRREWRIEYPICDLSAPTLLPDSIWKIIESVQILHLTNEDAEGKRNKKQGPHLFWWQIWEENQSLQNILWMTFPFMLSRAFGWKKEKEEKRAGRKGGREVLSRGKGN